MMTVLGRSLLYLLMGATSATYVSATPPPPPLPGGPEDANLSISANAEEGGPEVRIVMPDTGMDDDRQPDYSVEIIEIQEGDIVGTHHYDEPDDSTVFIFVEQMPEFRDGDETDFTRWVMRRLQYPVEAAEEGVQGRVVVRFIVEKCGNIGNFEVLSSPNELLEREVLRVMGQSPKWTPGKRHGVPVRVYFTLPVMFRLQS